MYFLEVMYTTVWCLDTVCNQRHSRTIHLKIRPSLQLRRMSAWRTLTDVASEALERLKQA